MTCPATPVAVTSGAGLTESCLAISAQFLQARPARAQSEAIASGIASQYSTATIFLPSRYHHRRTEETNFGSGFFISRDGYILTAAHLFQELQEEPVPERRHERFNRDQFRRCQAERADLPIELVRMNGDVDVALLKSPLIPPVERYNAVHFWETASIPQGARLHSLGFPLQQPLSVNSGTLSSKDGPRGLWKTDTSVNEGSSGGPVFVNSGHVVEVVKGGIQEAPGHAIIAPVNLIVDMIAGVAALDECQFDLTIKGATCTPTVRTVPGSPSQDRPSELHGGQEGFHRGFHSPAGLHHRGRQLDPRTY